MVALALGRLDAALHRTERPVAVHRPVEGGRRTRLGLLGEVGDGPAPRDPDVALLGQEASAKEEEEARLADPVPPHDTGAMARVHDEVEPREQGRRASLEGDVREVDHRRGGLGGGALYPGDRIGSLPARPLPGAAPPRPRGVHFGIAGSSPPTHKGSYSAFCSKNRCFKGRMLPLDILNIYRPNLTYSDQLLEPKGQKLPFGGHMTTSRQIESEIGSRLARLRLTRNVTQSTLAEDAGIGVRTLRRPRGRRTVDPRLLPPCRSGPGPRRCNPGRDTDGSDPPDRARLASRYRAPAGASAAQGRPGRGLDMGRRLR